MATTTLTELIASGRTVELVPTDDSPAFHEWDKWGDLSHYYDPQTGNVGIYDEHPLSVGLTHGRLLPVVVRP